MARVALSEVVLEPQGRLLTHIDGASVTINVRGGSAATLYAAATGSTTVAQPLTTVYGRVGIPGSPDAEVWITAGSYDMAILTTDGRSWTQRVEAASGSAESGIDVSRAPYLAVGDARAVTVTVGAGSTALTGTGFTSADNGKTISIGGAGPAAANLITTVTYVSSTQLTLAAATTGAVTGGSAALGTDDTAAFQAAINAAFSARKIRIPKPAGPIGFAYLITAPLTVTHPGLAFSGDSEHLAVWCAHTGVQFKNGSDNGHAYDANEYDGNESVRFENLLLKAFPASTALSNGQGNYSTGTYAIQDWRGGDVKLQNVRIEGFDYPFWGIQSDLNSWQDVTIINNHSGVYCGPRSDQWRCSGTVYFIFNDRAVDIDGGYGANFAGTIFVDNGSASINPVRVRSQWARGSRGITFDRCWFEHLLGAAAVEAFVEVGVGDTYVSDAIRFNNPFILTGTSGSGHHVQYFCKTGNCDNITVDDPVGLDNGALIDALFYHVDTVATPRLHIRIRRESVTSNTLARVVLGPGAATPNVIREDYGSGLYGIADNQTGRAQIQLAPNGNFPQLRFVSPDGTINWQVQTGLLNSQLLLRAPAGGGGLWSVQDKNSADQIKWSEAGGVQILGERQNAHRYYVNGANSYRESFPREFISTTAAPASGVMLLTPIVLAVGDVITNLHFLAGATGLTMGSNADGHAWGALYSTTLALVSQSADAPSLTWASKTWKKFVLGSPLTVTTPGLYYAAVMIAVGTGGTPTMPTIYATGGQSSVIAGSGNTDQPTGMKMVGATNGSGLGATAPAGPITLAALAQTAYAATS